MHRKCLLTAVVTFFLYFSSVAQTPSLAVADSLYAAQDWKVAKQVYEKVLADTSHNSVEWNRLGYASYNLGDYDNALSSYKKAEANKPPRPLQPYLFSRMAVVYAIKKDKQSVLDNLDKAVNAGYFNFSEMDTLKAFAYLQNDPAFKALRNKAYAIAYPCSADPKQHVFDFWIGEWDAYVTGTNTLAGYSVIQSASGGCMILENWSSAKLPYTGKSMNFIDAATGKWQQVWVGAEGGGQHVFTNGEYKDSAMRYEFVQAASPAIAATATKQASPATPELKGKLTFFNQGSNQVKQLSETSADGGKTWTTVYDFTYVRKKK